MSTARPGWWHGLPSITLDSGEMRVTCLPGRGAKIVSLTASDGYEWLAQPNLPIPPAPRYGDVFTDAGVFGWDECAPTIDACVLPDGTRMPDHGELWSASWTEDGNGRLSVHGRALDYEIERTTTLDGRTLTISYRVQGTGKRSPFLWAAHPLFRAPPGTQVQLGDADLTMLDVTSTSRPGTRWDDGRHGIDEVPPREYAKYYVQPDSRCDSVRLTHSGGRSLRMHWDGDAVPYLGIFLDNGRFCPEPAIAVEPSTGWYDALDRARAQRRVSWISADLTPLRWRVTVKLE